MKIHGQSLVIHVQKQKIYGGEEYEEAMAIFSDIHGVYPYTEIATHG